MFKYFPHTEKDIQEMLETIGVQTIDELFLDLPKKLKDKPDYQVPLAKSEIEHRIGFEWAFNKIDWHREEKLSKSFPAIYKFIYDLPKDYKPSKDYKWDTHNLIFVFDIDSFSQKKHHVQTVTFEKDELKYKIHKNYEIELATCPLPNIVEPINFRLEKFSAYMQYDIIPGAETPIANMGYNDVAQTYELLSIGNTYFCGKIFLSGLKNKVLGFKLSHNLH